MQAFSLKNLAPVPNVVVVVVVVANPKGKIRKKGERERRKKVSSLSPFASPQFSSFLQFNIFLTLAGGVEALINARITKRFARVATRENTKFKTQKAKKKLLLRRTMRELVTKNPGSSAVLFSHGLTC